MAGYSKENERQNKALQTILDGGTPEKRIFVSMMDKKKEKQGDRKSHLTDIMAEARVPWFCPSCDKVMKKKLDDKMWRLFGHCFDCQVQTENKLRVTGEYDEWAEKKVLKNQKSYLLEQLQSIEEWKNQTAPTFLNQANPDGSTVTKETWQVDTEKNKKVADEAITGINQLISDIEKKLIKLEK